MNPKTIWLLSLIMFGWVLAVGVDQVLAQNAESGRCTTCPPCADNNDDGDDGGEDDGDDDDSKKCDCRCPGYGGLRPHNIMEYAIKSHDLRADGGGEYEDYVIREIFTKPYGYLKRITLCYTCKSSAQYCEATDIEVHIRPGTECWAAYNPAYRSRYRIDPRKYTLLQWQQQIRPRDGSDGMPPLTGNFRCDLAGKGEVTLKSGGESVWGVYGRISLGTGQRGGRDVGDLWMHSGVPTADLAKPCSLNLAIFNADEVEEIRNNDNTNELRQVMVPQGLADVITENAFKYAVRFYHLDDVQPDYDENGYYVVKSGRTPYASWTFENPSGTTNDIDTLRVTKFFGGEVVSNDFVWMGSTNNAGSWYLTMGGLQIKGVTVISNESGRVITQEIRDSGENLVGKTQWQMQYFGWGEAMTARVRDPDGAALTTTIGYYENEAETGRYSRVKNRTYSDGSWERFDYDSYGKRTEKVSSWKDTATNASASEANAVTYEYAPVDENDLMEIYMSKPRAEIEKVEGKEVKRTYHAYYYNAYGEPVEIEEQAYAAAAAYGNTNNLRLTRVFYAWDADSGSARELKSITYPDGRQDTLSYEYGDFTADTNNPDQSAFTASSPGAFVRVTTVHGTSANPDGVANKTTKETRVEDSTGRVVMEEVYAYTGSGYERIKWALTSLDANGNPTHVYNSNGTESQATWGCCGKEWEKDETGIEYSYTYDALHRVTQKVKSGSAAAGGYPAQADQYTTYTYDAEGRMLTEVVSAGGLSQGRTNQYDMAGRLINSSDFAGLITATAYSQDGLTTTETLPGGYTRIVERYKDGQVKSITGTAQVPQYYAYGVNENGTKHTTVYSVSNESPVWVKTTTDLLGRTAKVEKPGYSGTETTEYTYNSKGQLIKTTTTGKPDTLYAYDEIGNQIQSGLDINANGALDLAGTDRISESDKSYVSYSSDWYLETISRIYATDNNSDSLTNSVTRQRLTGFSGNTVAETVSIDAYGNQSTASTVLDTSNKKITQTTDVPTSSSNIVSVSVNGLVQSQISPTGQKTTFAYDALGRRNTVTDARLGNSVTHYDSHGWIDYVEDAGSRRTSYTYDSATGRRLSQTDSMSNTSYMSYSSHGQLEKTWGSAGYPVLYEYDAYGRMVKMSTYRNGSGWSGSSWPASPGTADTTEWIYHEASGLLIAKKDAAGKQVSYTYSSGGKLASRTWARVNGTNSLVTTYSYSANSGDLTGIDYSDSTPDVSFTYDRLGRQKTADSSVSAHTFAYNGLLLDTETIVSSAGTNVIDRSYDSFGRASGFSAGRANPPGEPSYSVAYGYNNLGRFSSISSSVESVSSVVNYSYLQNSDLIEQRTMDSGLQTTFSYEQNRNLLTQIKNEVNSSILSQFDYANDNGGRRTSIKYSGSAFETGASFNQYQYNNRSEVIVGDRFWGSNINDTDNPVDGQGFAYAYDNIGNRMGASRGNEETTYTANSLNQYSERTVADLIDVIGSAETNTTVTVNDLATTRHEKYWYRGLDVTNDSAAVYQSVNVVGVYNPPDPNDPDIVTSVTGYVFVAKTPEQFSYDNDGNLLSDGRFNYTWDCENRLISVETDVNKVGTAVPAVRLEFSYDYMSRRVSKQVFGWDKNRWSPVESRVFVYDGWNMVQETTTESSDKAKFKSKKKKPDQVTDKNATTSTCYYTWGLDLSGTLQGAGGIGGLLAARLGTNNVCYTFDGNGNVSELISDLGPLTSVLVAHYEYSPFGETIVATGQMAKDNPFRFSTKFMDDETALAYYGYRYYSPNIGKWLSNDPLMDIGSTGTLLLRKQLIDFADLLIDAINKRLMDPNLTPLERDELEKNINIAGWIKNASSSCNPELFRILTGNNLTLFCGNGPIIFIDPYGQFFISPWGWFGAGLDVLGAVLIPRAPVLGIPILAVGLIITHEHIDEYAKIIDDLKEAIKKIEDATKDRYKCP